MATPPDFTAGQVLTAAQMNAVGNWLVTSASFTAATSIVANDVFSADFQDYLLVIRYSTSSTSGLGFNLRVAGVNATTNYNRQGFVIGGTSSSATRSTAQSSLGAWAPSTEGTISCATLLICGPNLAAPTLFSSNVARTPSNDYAQPTIELTTQNHSTATAYDGFELTVGVGNATGTYALYGMRR